jgi:hypothetical protein
VTNHQQSRADRAVVEQAARRLRDRAIADGYAGYECKHLAFGMALVLHELARHLRDLQTSDLTVRAALLLLIAVVVGIVAGLLAIEASADKAAA